MEVVKQLEMRTKAQLEEIVIYIPESWKLVCDCKGWKSEQGAMIVRKWLDEAQTFTADVESEKTDRDLETLCSSFQGLWIVASKSPSLWWRSVYSLSFSPNWIILLLCSITATWDYCSCKCILRYAWTALTAPSGQLDQVIRRKQGEFTVSRKELLAT